MGDTTQRLALVFLGHCASACAKTVSRAVTHKWAPFVPLQTGWLKKRRSPLQSDICALSGEFRTNFWPPDSWGPVQCHSSTGPANHDCCFPPTVTVLIGDHLTIITHAIHHESPQLIQQEKKFRLSSHQLWTEQNTETRVKSKCRYLTGQQTRANSSKRVVEQWHTVKERQVEIIVLFFMSDQLFRDTHLYLVTCILQSQNKRFDTSLVEWKILIRWENDDMT